MSTRMTAWEPVLAAKSKVVTRLLHLYSTILMSPRNQVLATVEAQPRLERAEDQVCHAGKLRPASCRFQAIGLRGGAYRSVNEMRLFLHSRCYPCQIC